MAQQSNRDAQNRTVRGPYETNRFFDNIFIGVGGGVNIYFGENDNAGKFGKRIAPAIDVNVGKWITPSIGVRIGYSGISANGWSYEQSPYAKKFVDSEGMWQEKFNVMYLHSDFMWNLSNAIGGYKPERTWNFVPFAGVGWARSSGNGTHDNEIAFNAGLLNIVRLCDALDLTIEVRGMLVNQRFDKVTGGNTGEGMLSMTAGLAYKFNRRDFKRAEKPVDVTSYINTIQELNKDNSALADENAKLRAQKPAEKVVTKTTTDVVASPVALFFEINKAVLDEKELTNLDFYVNNALKLDKNHKFNIIGSADIQTGTHEYNQKLSEQRMMYIYNLLVKKYNIAPERLVKKAEGDTNNRFPQAELNRAVFILE